MLGPSLVDKVLGNFDQVVIVGVLDDCASVWKNINSRTKFWNDGSKKPLYIRLYYFEGHKQFIFYNIKKHILLWNGINLLLIFTLISFKSPPQSTSKYQNKKSIKVVINVETIKMLKLINPLKDHKIEIISWRCALKS